LSFSQPQCTCGAQYIHAYIHTHTRLTRRFKLCFWYEISPADVYFFATFALDRLNLVLRHFINLLFRRRTQKVFLWQIRGFKRGLEDLEDLRFVVMKCAFLNWLTKRFISSVKSLASLGSKRKTFEMLKCPAFQTVLQMLKILSPAELKLLLFWSIFS
jgi:hypothetical protein